MAEKKPNVEFSQSVFDRICDLLADGKSLRAACTGKGLPDRTTFMRWSKLTPELKAQYDAACLEREEAIFDDIIHIGDTERDPARARVKTDNRKWVLARMNRKKYGDKMGLDGGEDGSPIKIVRLNMAPVEELPE